MVFRSISTSLLTAITCVACLAGCGDSGSDGKSTSRLPEMSGPPKYPAVDTPNRVPPAKDQTIEATAIRKTVQRSNNGKWEDAEQINLVLDIISEQAGDAFSYFDLVVSEIVVDGKPATRVDEFNRPVTGGEPEEAERIRRGSNRDRHQSKKGRFSTNLNINAASGAEKVDRISGSVKLELAAGDWIRISSIEQGPITHPKLTAMNIPAAVYRPVASIVGVEFAEEPPYLRTRLVDASGNDITPSNHGTGKQEGSYVVTHSFDEAVPEGTSLEMTFAPLPVVEVPFVIEGLEITTQKQVNAKRAKAANAAAANYKSTATGVIHLGDDAFAIKDAYVLTSSISPDDYVIYLFDFPLTDEDKAHFARKGTLAATTIGDKKRSPTPDKWDLSVIELGIDFDSNKPGRTLQDVRHGAFRFLAKRLYPGSMDEKDIRKHFQEINLTNGVLTVKTKSAMEKNGVNYKWDFQLQCKPYTK